MEKSQASVAAAAAAVGGAAAGVPLSQTQGQQQQQRKKKKVKPAVTEMISGEAVQSSNQTMWLVKLPAFVADEWAKMGDNEVLGSMKITMAPGAAGKKINIKLNVNEKKKKMSKVGGATGEMSDDDGAADELIPDEFTLDDVPGAPKMFSFSGDDDTERFVMQGQISKNLLLKPKGTKEYQEYLWNRNVKTTARREAIKTSDDKAAFAVSRSDTIIDFAPPAAALQKRKAKEISQGAKRAGGADAALEIKAIRAKLFEYLSKIERTTLGDLQAFCSDVEGYTNARLKELMDDYCRYNPKGPYKHLYELKPEFKDNLKKPESVEGL
jgi:hypothetical protein